MSTVMMAKVFGVMTVAFVALDLLWVGVVANRFYNTHLGFMLRPDVRWAPVILFYVLFNAGVLVLVVMPSLERASPSRALLLGALLGLVAYGTYDLINLGLTEGFPRIVAAVDMVWGMGITAATAAIGFGAARWMEG